MQFNESTKANKLLANLQ